MADLTPDDNNLPDNSAQQIAQKMDPNVANALQESLLQGDDSIQRLITKNGITTTDQLLDAAMQAGVTENLPQNLQIMIDEKNRDRMRQNDDVSIKAKKEEAEAAFAALAVGRNNDAMFVEGRDGGESGTYKSYSEMTKLERVAHLNEMSQQTFQQFSSLSKDERSDEGKFLVDAGRDKAKEAAEDHTAWENKVLADTKLGNYLDRQTFLDKIYEVGVVEGSSKLQSEAEFKNGTKDWNAHEQELAREWYINQKRMDVGVNTANHGAESVVANENDNVPKSFTEVKQGVEQAQKDTHEIAAAYDGTAADRHDAKVNALAVNAVEEKGVLAATGNKAAVAEMDQASLESMQMRAGLLAKERTETAPQKTGAQANKDDLFDDQPAVASVPAPETSVAPRLTVEAAKLGTCGLDKLCAPEVVAVNNDPAPEVKHNKPSASMGGMGA